MQNDPCARICPLLPWYVTDRLSPEERELVERHLPGCPDCRRELAGWREIAGAANDASQLHQPPPQMRRRVWERLHEHIAASGATATLPAPSRDGKDANGSLVDLGILEPVPSQRGQRERPRSRNPFLPVAAVLIVLVLAVGLAGFFRNAAGTHPTTTPHPTPAPTVARVAGHSFISGVYGLNPKTGTLVWSYAQAPFANQVAQSQGRVYFLGQTTSGGGEVVALDFLTGDIDWRAPVSSVFGAVAATGGIVFYTSESATTNELVAFNAATGKQTWHMPFGTDFVASMSVNGGALYALATSGKIIAFQATTGTVLWQNGQGNGAVVANAAGIFATQTCGGSSIIISSTSTICLASLESRHRQRHLEYTDRPDQLHVHRDLHQHAGWRDRGGRRQCLCHHDRQRRPAQRPNVSRAKPGGAFGAERQAALALSDPRQHPARECRDHVHRTWRG